MDKFTGGEWRVIQPLDPCGNYGIWAEEAGGHYIIHDGPRYLPQGIWGRTPEEARANAVLMAAGPNMLKALLEVWKAVLRAERVSPEAERMVQAAIREATILEVTGKD